MQDNWFTENADELCGRFGLGRPEAIGQVEGGGRSDVLRVTIGGMDYALRRLHPTIDAEGARYIHGVMRALASSVPEVTACMVADGEGFVTLGGRIVTVSPWFEGATPKRTDDLTGQIAGLLGRLHRAASRIGNSTVRGDRPPFYALPRISNYIYDLDNVRKALFETPECLYASRPVAEHPCIDYILENGSFILEEHRRLVDFLSHVDSISGGMLHAPIHADIYRANLLCADGVILKLIDWDECKLEILSYELGRVLWEECQDHKTSVLNETKARLFVERYYQAGGTAPEGELHYLNGFIRMIRIHDTLQYVNCSVIGDWWSAPYAAENIRALHALPDYLDTQINW